MEEDTTKVAERLAKVPDGELALIISALSNGNDWYDPSRVDLLRLACQERDARLALTQFWKDFVGR